jgi:hypothetical protein
MPASPSHKSRKHSPAGAHSPKRLQQRDDSLSKGEEKIESKNESSTNPNPEEKTVTSPKSGSAKKRHHSKSNGPRLNTWDVPEFLPGAQPGATAVQREYFQERSIKVFRNEQRMQKQEAEESSRRSNERMAVKLAQDIAHLHDLFPSLDIEVIQETYLLAENNLNNAINQLLVIAEGTSTGNTPKSQKKGPPSSEDEKEFPSLADKDGWEVVPSEIEMTIENVDESDDTQPKNYKDRLLSNDGDRMRKL